MLESEFIRHIRNIYVAGDNDDLFPVAQASYKALVETYDTWKADFGEGSEMPNIIWRIHRILGSLDGTIKEVNVNEEPWVTVSMLEMNLLNRKGDIDLMPTMQVPKMIRDWVGEAGTEPDWLIEADRLLCEHHYRVVAKDFGFEEDEIDELYEASAQERAAAFALFG